LNDGHFRQVACVKHRYEQDEHDSNESNQQHERRLLFHCNILIQPQMNSTTPVAKLMTPLGGYGSRRGPCTIKKKPEQNNKPVTAFFMPDRKLSS